jgi:hypothetical protein
MQGTGLRAQDTGQKRKKRTEKIIYFIYKLILLFLPILGENEI